MSDRNHEIRAAFASGEAKVKIAKRHGISRERVRQIVNKMAKQRHGSPRYPDNVARIIIESVVEMAEGKVDPAELREYTDGMTEFAAQKWLKQMGDRIHSVRRYRFRSEVS